MANEKVRETNTVEAKRIALAAVAEGKSVAEAMSMAKRSYKQWEYWKKNDEKFRRDFDAIRTSQRVYKKSSDRTEFVGTFESFSERYLETKVFPHQQNIIDVVEGREPTWLHQAMKYQKGYPEYVLVNVPPDHAKSTTVSVNYSTYRICQDPNVRIILVSKTQELAKQFLYSVKQRLTHPKYADMQYSFAPEGGFKSDTAIWQSERVYLGDELRDSGEASPTIQALGIGGQIYGNRSDLIILDDCVLLSNAHEYEKQIRWIQQEVISRLKPGDRLLVLGTRVDNLDLYSEIMRADRYPDNVVPWTMLRMPAVLDFTDDKKDWVTLWPKSDRPWNSMDITEPDKDGLYPRWDGPALAKRRGVTDPKTWAMVYQQQDVSEDSIFNSFLIRKAVNGSRKVGPLRPNTLGHPRLGMAGMYVVCSLDPAMGGDAAAIALAVDRQTKMRYLLDARLMTNPTPKSMRSCIEEFTEAYSPNEWRIEKNSFQKYMTQDEDLRAFLSSRGVPLKEVFTGAQKWDVEWGVASMAPLFGWAESDEHGRPHNIQGCQIELPSSANQEGVKALIEQLITWEPKTKNKTDMVMALWFAEVAAREQVNVRGINGRSHMTNQFASPELLARRKVVDLNEVWEARGRITA